VVVSLAVGRLARALEQAGRLVVLLVARPRVMRRVVRVEPE
jgi:hypothetical protein